MHSFRFSLALAAGVCFAAAAWAADVTVPLPDYVLPPEIPEDNPVTEAKVDLGQALYFDTRLSSDGTVSCATCHAPETGFVDPRGTPTSAGIEGLLGTRNAPTTLNAAFLTDQFWDGRAATLEEQAVAPFLNPVEMNIKDEAALAALVAGIDGYPAQFEKAFGSPEVTAERIGQAIASFERTLISVDAPIDRYVAGDETAISDAAKRGWELFNGKARCNTCHGYVDAFPLMTDEQYHNIGVGKGDVNFEELSRAVQQSPEAFEDLAFKEGVAELGRFIVTRQQRDIGAFKTPQLRNIALTAPYMHDGSEKTLLDVINFYDRGGENNPFLDGGIRPLGLTDQEKSDLVELMQTFTSDDLDRFQNLDPNKSKP